jgi:hypothetical protein
MQFVVMNGYSSKCLLFIFSMTEVNELENQKTCVLMCINVFLYGKTHVSFIFHIKKHSISLGDNGWLSF